MIFWACVRWVYRVIERPAPVHTARQVAHALARTALEGALLAEAERIVD